MKRDPSTPDGTPGLGDQYKDERTEKKIQEHLNNENDIITEEDIANAPTGLVNKENVPEATETTAADATEESTPEKKKEENIVKDNTDPGIQTSWNVLES